MKAKMNRMAFWISEVEPLNLKKLFVPILAESGFGILKQSEHYFKPFGYTGLWLLSESHFAIHTFPEENKTYCELSSCIDTPFHVFRHKLEKVGLVMQPVIENG